MAKQYEKLFVLIDSNESDAQLTANHIQAHLEQYDAELASFTDAAEALNFILTSPRVSLVITEYRLEGMGGLELISSLTAQRPRLPSIMLSDSSDATIAIKAVQAGAYDFLPKPCDPAEFHEVLAEALNQEEAESPLEPPKEESKAAQLIGQSRAMAKVYRDLAKLAATPVTVLIQGETGTGKELIARALHEHGHRAHKPFIPVNCAAIPDNLLESELFGHERGAFTGAVTRKLGRFEQAQGATLFLDEIGDMPPLLQAKMLRVLQEKVIQRVGGTSEIAVDVRIIAATHRNIGKMVEKGTFRADLFFRLNASTLRLPPLRERLGDVNLLTKHFFRIFGSELGIDSSRITPNALSFLARQTWPGNVRQLQNVIRQVVLKKRGLTINTADLRALIENEASDDHDSLVKLANTVIAKADAGQLPDGAYRAMTSQTERVLIQQMLNYTDGNQSKAAELLGITRYTLRERIKKLEILF